MKKRLFSLSLALFLLLALTPPALAVSQVEGPDTAAIAEGVRRFEDIQGLPGPFVRTAEELAAFVQAQVDARNEDFAGQELYNHLIGWEPYYALVPIQETDRHFFYNSDSFASCSASSLEELAAYTLDQLYGQGQERCQLLLEGWKDEIGEGDFAAAFNAVLKRQSGPNTAWSYRCIAFGDDMFVTMYIRFA